MAQINSSQVYNIGVKWQGCKVRVQKIVKVTVEAVLLSQKFLLGLVLPMNWYSKIGEMVQVVFGRVVVLLIILNVRTNMVFSPYS